MNLSIIRTTMFAVLVSFLVYGGVAFADHSSEPLPAADVTVTTHAETAPSHSASESHSHECTITENLTLGSRGESVECLQEYLIAEGLLSSKATGYYGEMTKEAVAKWQTKKGISATGAFGPLSRAAFTDHAVTAAVSSHPYYAKLQKAHENMMQAHGDGSMSTTADPKIVAVLLYDGFAILDAVGPIQTLGSLLDYKVVTVAKQKGEITSDNGVKMVADYSLSEIKEADVLVIPGGLMGTIAASKDAETLAWIRAIDATTEYTTSVCTGSWILAATGLLKGKEASTHWSASEYLEDFGVKYTGKRYTVDGKYVTSAGVSGGIDMALALAGMLEGEDAAKTVQLVMEYDPQPPFNSGSPKTADPELVKIFLAMNDDHIKAGEDMAKSATHDATHVEDHAHTMVDVASWSSVPTVRIVAHKDTKSGWNLEITPTNFRFAPEHVSGAVVANEGHAHLYIDGKKIGRVYGNWISLPNELFSGSGSHEILVTLNANNHSDLSYQGTRIEAKTSVTK